MTLYSSQMSSHLKWCKERFQVQVLKKKAYSQDISQMLQQAHKIRF